MKLKHNLTMIIVLYYLAYINDSKSCKHCFIVAKYFIYVNQ